MGIPRTVSRSLWRDLKGIAYELMFIQFSELSLDSRVYGKYSTECPSRICPSRDHPTTISTLSRAVLQ